MLEFTNFQIKQNEAAQQAVVKNQIDHEVFFIKSKAHLTPDKCKTSAKFQKELLQVVDDSAFQLTF